MRAVIVTYTLRDGRRGQLHGLMPSTCAALLSAIDLFGDLLRTASARAA